jgi:hypothetical protein
MNNLKYQAAQVSPQIDAARAEKERFRMELANIKMCKIGIKNKTGACDKVPVFDISILNLTMSFRKKCLFS